MVPHNQNIVSRCGKSNCEAEHILRLENTSNGKTVLYDRYTMKYPIENYDSIDWIVRLNANESDGTNEDSPGPIVIYKRKKRFSVKERAQIWNKTMGLCHLCGAKVWRLDEYGRFGWHIDHVIPHTGGGIATEEMDNFLMACHECNLRKGKGWRTGEVRDILRTYFSL